MITVNSSGGNFTVLRDPYMSHTDKFFQFGMSYIFFFASKTFMHSDMGTYIYVNVKKTFHRHVKNTTRKFRARCVHTCIHSLRYKPVLHFRILHSFMVCTYWSDFKYKSKLNILRKTFLRL